ncbi:30S ribosomal protein S19e [Candidatus Woesearchaeota archaeon]|nr:30S ribosomal protein S19e [Candidatus Woesearchaeota archaeon]
MATIFDVNPEELVKVAAEALKKEIKTPPWTMFVKTSSGHERPPMNPEWYYHRAASIMRKVYLLGPIGTQKLRRKYGIKKNHMYKPERTKKGAGKIIRSILQQLEQVGYLSKETKNVHKGRILTPKGKSFLDKLATQLLKSK